MTLCLGTSLQIEPAASIPFLNHKSKSTNRVIVNLQKTPKDKKATLIIRGKVDKVMEIVMRELGIECEKYETKKGTFLSFQIDYKRKELIINFDLSSDGLT